MCAVRHLETKFSSLLWKATSLRRKYVGDDSSVYRPPRWVWDYIYETRNNTVYFHSKNKFWSDEINFVRRQTTSWKSCRTFLSDDKANQMSPDLMHMGSALHLDSSHNDDLFIFGAVFIGGFAKTLIRSGHANDQFINGSPNGKTEMRERHRQS